MIQPLLSCESTRKVWISHSVSRNSSCYSYFHYILISNTHSLCWARGVMVYRFTKITLSYTLCLMEVIRKIFLEFKGNEGAEYLDHIHTHKSEIFNNLPIPWTYSIDKKEITLWLNIYNCHTPTSDNICFSYLLFSCLALWTDYR